MEVPGGIQEIQKVRNIPQSQAGKKRLQRDAWGSALEKKQVHAYGGEKAKHPPVRKPQRNRVGRRNMSPWEVLPDTFVTGTIQGSRDRLGETARSVKTWPRTAAQHPLLTVQAAFQLLLCPATSPGNTSSPLDTLQTRGPSLKSRHPGLLWAPVQQKGQPLPTISPAWPGLQEMAYGNDLSRR